MRNETKILISLLVIAGALAATGFLISGPKKQPREPKKARWTQDPKTVNIIRSLHPKIRRKISNFFTEVEKKTGLTLKATSGLRDCAKQNMLHASNRANPPCGHSDHNFGLAVDVNALNDRGQIVLRKASTKQAWLDSGIVAVADRLGLHWGGRWRTYHDPIHFYHETGHSTTYHKELLAAGKVDKEGYIKI